ncbi:MAG: hypothetical protein ACXIU2_11675, partial [Cyclobacteriaceae bacterium]
IILIAVALFTLSCEQDYSDNTEFKKKEIQINEKEAKITFALALRNAIFNEPELRNLIKEEALKMFNGDYDILYHTFKETLMKSGKSVHETILDYSENREKTNSAIQNLPLLTILVPDLIDFTAFDWDSENELVDIAIDDVNDRKTAITAISSDGEKYEIPRGYQPAYPIIVIKNNERIISSSDTQIKNYNNLGDLVLNLNGESYFITDNNYKTKDINHNYENEAISRIETNSSYFRVGLLSDYSHIINAIESEVEWQRDNIYYGLDASQNITRGPLNRKYMEVITGMRFNFPPADFNFISNSPEDPSPTGNDQMINILPEWTDGYFDFEINVLITTPTGQEKYVRSFSLKPYELFNIKYRIENGGRGRTFRIFEGISEEAPTVSLNIPIEDWNFERYGNTWKFVIIEKDPDIKTTITTTNQTKIGTNFEFGEKVGFKFGATGEITESESFAIETTQSSDLLGEARLHFEDPIFLNYTISNGNWPIGCGGRNSPPCELINTQIITYEPYTVTTGRLHLIVEPIELR